MSSDKYYLKIPRLTEMLKHSFNFNNVMFHITLIDIALFVAVGETPSVKLTDKVVATRQDVYAGMFLYIMFHFKAD